MGTTEVERLIQELREAIQSDKAMGEPISTTADVAAQLLEALETPNPSSSTGVGPFLPAGHSHTAAPEGPRSSSDEDLLRHHKHQVEQAESSGAMVMGSPQVGWSRSSLDPDRCRFHQRRLGFDDASLFPQTCPSCSAKREEAESRSSSGSDPKEKLDYWTALPAGFSWKRDESAARWLLMHDCGMPATSFDDEVIMRARFEDLVSDVHQAIRAHHLEHAMVDGIRRRCPEGHETVVQRFERQGSWLECSTCHWVTTVEPVTISLEEQLRRDAEWTAKYFKPAQLLDTLVAGEYVLEIYQEHHDRWEWVVWTKGPLQDVLSDFFEQQTRPSSPDRRGLRMTWRSWH